VSDPTDDPGRTAGTPAATLVLRARHVLSMCGPPLDGGWVRVERGRIVAVGTRSPGVPCHDLGDAIILPGLVNAHTHLEFSDLDRPLAAAGGLPGWIERVVAARRARGSMPAVEAGRLEAAYARGLGESAAAGVTAIGDIATALPPPPAGPRPLVRSFREALGLTAAAVRGARAAVAADLDRLERSGRLCGVSPHAPYSTCRPLGLEMVGMARRRRLPVMMHLAESAEEMELLASGGGAMRGLLGRLGAWPEAAVPELSSVADWISLLARGPRAVVVHGTFLAEDPSALTRLARHRDRMCVAVCPRTTLALSGRLPPVDLFRSAGVRVAIGTDSRASTPDLAPLAECRTLAEAGLVRPAGALSMATREAAWALALDGRRGRVAPGCAADLVVLRPAEAGGDPHDLALDPTTSVAATLSGGRLIAGAIG